MPDLLLVSSSRLRAVFFLTFLLKMILLGMPSLPPLRTSLSGHQWTARQTCVFNNYISSDEHNIKMLITKRNSLVLNKAMTIIYNLLVQGDSKAWHNMYIEPPEQYINTIIKLIEQSKRHEPSKLVVYCYTLKTLLEPTPDKMILGKWEGLPQGATNCLTEVVYHRLALPGAILLSAHQIFFPAVIGLLEGNLEMSTILFKGLHDKVDTTSLDDFYSNELFAPRENNNDMITILSAFSRELTQHIKEFDHSPIELSQEFDETLDDVI